MRERDPTPPSPPPPEITGRVIPFVPRRSAAHPHSLSTSSAAWPCRASENQGGDGDDSGDDFRHRMKTNLATLAVVVVLICCGLWLADTIAEMRKTQDCVLSGRRNCAPVVLPEHQR